MIDLLILLTAILIWFGSLIMVAYMLTYDNYITSKEWYYVTTTEGDIADIYYIKCKKTYERY